MAKGEYVFYRKDSRFEARYVKGRGADGKPVYGSCYGRTYEEAREKAAQARQERRESQAGRDNSINTVSQFCDDWLSSTIFLLSQS